MLFTKELLDNLTAQAKENERLRMHCDLRDTTEDQSQRILNAMEPGTVLPIHRHRGSSETVVMLRGKEKWFFYDDNGKVDEEVVSYARQTGKPVLDYPGEADYYSACNDFYTLVCGGDDGDEEEESFIIPRK